MNQHAYLFCLYFSFLLIAVCNQLEAQNLPYAIVDTDINEFTSDTELITAPDPGDPFYGQDAHYAGNQPSYTDNDDGTITDNITGLMWQQDMGEKISYADAFIKADSLSLGEYNDWRVPSIKELYSLILFTGQVKGATFIRKFIDEEYFHQPIGNTEIGEREIDAQTWSSTQYVGLTMNGDSTVFGVNFIDGRIKGYPQYQPGSSNSVPKTMYFRMVRGNTAYGQNTYLDNKDGTISDLATGLMWQQADDGVFRDWEEALAYAESLELGGYNDWRLPNAKELQSLLDYSRSPQTTDGPAIDPLFSCTEIDDPDGNPGQYPYYWSSTTHQDGVNPYSSAVYVAFGEAQGEMNNQLLDVHGAGSQRSDPKSGSPDNYPAFFGPQGDVRYVFNAVRCVRDLSSASTIKKKPGEEESLKLYPNPVTDLLTIEINDESDHHLVLHNLTGQVMKTWQIRNSSTIDLSTLSAGIYFLVLDELSSRKIVKR